MNEGCDFEGGSVAEYADYFRFAAVTQRQYRKTSGHDLSANPDMRMSTPDL
jgi:hypothetical protein